MCTSNVQIMINFDDESKKMWNFLKIRFESIDWINKWTIMNRFEKFHYDEIKNMMIYNETLTKFKQKIIDFNINMKNAFVIKILNKLFFDFYTFFAIKNNEFRIDKKFFEFEKLMQHLKKKSIETKRNHWYNSNRSEF